MIRFGYNFLAKLFMSTVDVYQVNFTVSGVYYVLYVKGDFLTFTHPYLFY